MRRTARIKLILIFQMAESSAINIGMSIAKKQNQAELKMKYEMQNLPKRSNNICKNNFKV